MPRLTTKQYLRTHDQLRRFWLQQDRLYAELSPTEQWQLHDYFQPSKDWSDLQLLAHRDAITKQRPSLPHQAGRALSKFQERAAVLALHRVRAAKAPVIAGKKPRRQGDRQLSVKAVVRPEIDVEKLARAFINLARDIAKRRRQWLAQVALRDVDRPPAGGKLSPRLEMLLKFPHIYGDRYC